MTGAGSPPVPGGGPISVVAGCTLTVAGTVSSRGLDPGADLVHLEGCDVTISGLVESTGAGHGPPGGVHCRETPANATGCVEVWAHGTLTITGEINADLCCAGGTDGTSWIDLFAAGRHRHHRWDGDRTPCTPTRTRAPGAAVRWVES